MAREIHSGVTMNILVIAHRLPYPPDKGEKIRSYHHLKYLAAHHKVWLATLIDDPNDWQHVGTLRALCQDFAVSGVNKTIGLARGGVRLLTGGTITEGYFSGREIQTALNNWKDRIVFDAVLAFSSGTARYGLDIPAKRRILEMCDVDSAKWAEMAESASQPKKTLLRIEAKRMSRREYDLACSYDLTTLASQGEVEAFKGVIAAHSANAANAQEITRRVRVIRNGVDLDQFRPSDTPPDPGVVGFVGTMDYPPNVDAVCWFVEDIWPRVRSQHKNARFLIVGRTPSAEVRWLANQPGVTVTGSVPDVREYLNKMEVFVAPLRQSHGIANKVVEALASGKAVVTGAKTAAAIGLVADRDARVADEETAIAESVSALLSDSDRRRALAQSARRFAEKEYRWDDRVREMEGLLAD